MKWWKVISVIGVLNRLVKNHTFAPDGDAHQPIGEEIYNHPGLSIVFDLVSERFDAQRERLNSLDAKANFALTAATTLVSAGLVLQSLILPHSHSACSIIIPSILHKLPELIKRALPLLPLLFVYFIVIVIGCFAYKIREFSQVPKPRLLIEYLPYSEYYVKAVVLSTMIEAYEENAKKLDDKASLIDWAFLALVIEAAMLVFLLLYQGIC
jgi:hypothetical protein